MRTQSQVGQKLKRQAAGRTCFDVGGMWADQSYDKAMKQVMVKAMSRLLPSAGTAPRTEGGLPAWYVSSG